MRVMSLKDGTKKMSKSDASDMSTIYMMDDADTIAKKIKRATTDPEALPSEAAGLAGRAEAENLVGIYAALSDTSVDDVLAEFGGKGWGKFKPALADLAVAVLSPIAERDEAAGGRSRRDGRASCATAPSGPGPSPQPIMDDVRKIVGFMR